MADEASPPRLPACALCRSEGNASLERTCPSVSLKGFPSGYTEHRKRGRATRVTMQALAHTFESAGLVLFPGPPMRPDNCRGATPDPRERNDYRLLEECRWSSNPPELVDSSCVRPAHHIAPHPAIGGAGGRRGAHGAATVLSIDIIQH